MDFFSHNKFEPREPENFHQYENLDTAVQVLKATASELKEALDDYRWADRPDGPPEEVPSEVYSDVVDIAEGLLLEVGAVRPVTLKPSGEIKEVVSARFCYCVIGLAFVGITVAAVAAWMN